MAASKKPMPEWLQTSLIADGTMTASKITHHPQERRCPHCRAACLTAIPAYEAPAAWVDETPLDLAGELAALMENRPTFDFYRDEGLERRFAHDIRDAPASKSIVLREHRCGSPPLPPTETKQSVPTNGTPPY